MAGIVEGLMSAARARAVWLGAAMSGGSPHKMDGTQVSIDALDLIIIWAIYCVVEAVIFLLRNKDIDSRDAQE
jgi:hypothetical protein